MNIEFIKSRKLRIRFYSIIINVKSISRAFGSVGEFAASYDLTGTTNGELLILYFMSYPGEYYDSLVTNVFRPNGIKYKKDFVLIEEELAFGVRSMPSPGLNRPLNCLEGISWLGSVLREDGNWVWKERLQATGDK